MEKFIPVYTIDMSGNEKVYVNDCLNSGWISSSGHYHDLFEEAVKGYVGARNAVAVSNGTVALHLALHCLGIGFGDEVIVPTFTYIASVNTIAQTGAKPVFVDVSASDWLIDTDDISRKFSDRTKAIMVVHLYGAICNMDEIIKIARDRGVYVIEDCAEAFGSFLGGKHSGTFGDIATFSFFGNKTITTGEGGMVITNDDQLAMKIRKIKSQGQSSIMRYWHDELGFNYRMTNICAAIGLAQLERIEDVLMRKRSIAEKYKATLGSYDFVFQRTPADLHSSEWLVSLLLPDGTPRHHVMERMRLLGVDSRPVFYCAHKMPMYFQETSFPVAEIISGRGISLPSYPTLTIDEIERVCKALIDCTFT